MSELRVVAVTVKDVLGAREFAMEPGRVTTLAGKNGSGKSTALQAVQAALGGGSLARLARVDPDGKKVEPEVVLVIEGPGSEAYRVERTGERLRVRARVGDTAAYEDVGKPQGWLSSLYDATGANPVAFLNATDDVRATMLLEALPLAYDRTELLTGMGVTLADLPPIPTGLHPLEDIAWIRGGVFSTRTGVNRDQKAAKAAGDQLRRNTPAVVPDDHAAELVKLRAQREEVVTKLAADRERAKADEDRLLAAAWSEHAREEDLVTEAFKRQAGKLRAGHAGKAAEIRAEAERRIALMAAGTEEAIEDLRTADEAALAANDAKRDQAIKAARTAKAAADQQLAVGEAALQSLAGVIADMEAKSEGAARARALHEQAKQFDDEAKRLAEESERLTAAIDALDAFRRQLAKDLPIPGLEVEGKQIRVNGIPYEQLNMQARVDIAVDVAVLRMGRLPLLFVDGAEALDSEHFAALTARLRQKGIQAFIARVTDEDFHVTTEGAA